MKALQVTLLVVAVTIIARDSRPMLPNEYLILRLSASRVMEPLQTLQSLLCYED